LKSFQFTGYYPGVVGKITEIHAVYYHEHWGFDDTFETQVGSELSEFISKFDDSNDGLWVATKDGIFAGSVAIDGYNARVEGARLRWFIVAPEFQNAGIGKKLISQAVEFCRMKKYLQIERSARRGSMGPAFKRAKVRTHFTGPGRIKLSPLPGNPPAADPPKRGA
jgi:GNAT superfamily N-acetyltransferase